MLSEHSAMPSYYFNSHAHVERDPRWLAFLDDIFNFNSHAHVERDCGTEAVFRSRSHFNSHAHVERDRISKRKYYLNIAFQLTRSRGA